MSYEGITAEMDATIHRQVNWDLTAGHMSKVLDHPPCFVRSLLCLLNIHVLWIDRRLVGRAGARDFCLRSDPLALLRPHHIVLVDKALHAVLLHVPRREDQTVVLKVFHREVIKANRLLCVATA